MIKAIETQSDPCVVGIVSDTHIPDRVRALHPALLDELRSHQVDLILHAGDISVRSVITQLEAVAPVYAVTGNRDILLVNEYPVSQTLKIHGTVLALTHGHLNPPTYWLDKFAYITRGYSFARYQKRLVRAFPKADIIVFGHTHHAENRRVGKKLYFNPGSVSRGDYLDTEPKFGVIRIYKDGRIEADILGLAGAEIKAKEWVKLD
jgi:putative phosphoesterase